MIHTAFGEPAILASFLAALMASAGIGVILFNAGWAERHLDAVLSFASGMLVATAILHLMPEGMGVGPHAAVYILAGFLILSISDQVLSVSRGDKHLSDGRRGELSAAAVPIVGIGFHSFVDGLEYPILFAHDPFTGLLASSGLILHEFAEGAIVFAILRASGRGALVAAFGALVIAAATTPIGALLSQSIIGPLSEQAVGQFLALAAGALLYVGAAHLPRHIRRPGRFSNLFFFMLAVAIAGALSLTHGFESGHVH